MNIKKECEVLFGALSGMERSSMNAVQKQLMSDISDNKISIGNLLSYLNNDKTFAGTPVASNRMDIDMETMRLALPKAYSASEINPSAIIDLGDDWNIEWPEGDAPD